MSDTKAPSEDDLKNFCTVTGASIERAKFYVEAANGNLEIAIESFFESGGNDDNAMDEEPLPIPNPSNISNNGEDSDEDPDFNPFEQLSKLSKPKPEGTRKQPARKAGKIFSLSDMNNDNEEDDEDDDEKGDAYYAGGSRTSGQQIIGPRKKNPEKIIKDLFEKAKEHGATEVDQSEGGGASTSSKKSYQGTGYRLGTGGEPSEVIQGAAKPKETKVSILKLWKNGFNVDDGDLRSYEDEINKEFLASIQRGELPRELINQAQGGEVHLDMQDHRDQEFVPAKKAYVLHSSEGHKLGSESSSAPAVVSTASASDKVSSEEVANKNLGLDAAQPSTQIQFRLSDGSRLIIKANLTHKLSDLRAFINTARPEYASRHYTLMTSFPNKELTNDTETIEQANLKSATVMQKL